MAPASSRNCLKITTHYDSTTDRRIDSGGDAASAGRGALGRQYALLGAADRAGLRGSAALGAPPADLSGAWRAHGKRDPCAHDRSLYAAGVGGARAAGLRRPWISCRLPAALRSR